MGFPDSWDNRGAAGSALPGMLDSIWYCLPVNSTPPKQPGSFTVHVCVDACVMAKVEWGCVYVCVYVYVADSAVCL